MDHCYCLSSVYKDIYIFFLIDSPVAEYVLRDLSLQNPTLSVDRKRMPSIAPAVVYKEHREACTSFRYRYRYSNESSDNGYDFKMITAIQISEKVAQPQVSPDSTIAQVKDVARDKLDAKSVKCTFIGYGSDEMGYRFWDSKGHMIVQSKDVIFSEDSLYGAKAATDSSNLTKPIQKSQESPGGSSDTNKGSENSGSFEDSERSDEEDSKDGAFSEEEVFETPQWEKAINERMCSFVKISAGMKASQSLWMLMVKEEHDGKKRYKARLVVKSFQQKQRVDYNEIFSPIVKMTTIRVLVSWERRKPRVQVEKKSVQIKASTETMKVGSSSIILLLYVDDILVAVSNMAEIKKLKRKLSQEFEMKDLGPPKQILGVSIIRDRMKGTLRLSQEKYIGKVLEKINIKDLDTRCHRLGDHFKLIGSVMYVMVCTRLDIAYAVGVVSRFMSNPRREHWEVVKWLLRYLKGTSKATLCFSRKEVVLEGFSNLDYGSCLDSGKSTAGYVFIVGGTAVSWMSRIQKYFDMSTTEAGYMAIVEAGKELSVIHLAKNSVFHGRTKHIKIRYHYIRELVSEGMLSLKTILGAKNLADMLTKVVTTKKLKLCATLTGLRDN
ncbi:retrovirus-related pol polyprotein from transposon TNT 1-94 [Tanacetum coccineum]